MKFALVAIALAVVVSANMTAPAKAKKHSAPAI